MHFKRQSSAYITHIANIYRQAPEGARGARARPGGAGARGVRGRRESQQGAGGDGSALTSAAVSSRHSFQPRSHHSIPKHEWVTTQRVG